MPKQPIRDVRGEIYLTLLLLGADPMVLRAVESWNDGMSDEELLADLRNWNEAKLMQLEEWLPTLATPEMEAAQERIRRYAEARALRAAA